jgi:tetratricopeptide (TPR) repeat protein/glycosyltransferase involved in cell wall biosynthesis
MVMTQKQASADRGIYPLPEGRSILLTAIVSTYNAADYLCGCLDDLVMQTIADRLEIIVIDSASQQNEAEIVEDYQKRYPNIKYLRTPARETVYQAWNRGIKIAAGEYITNANTDDRHRRDAFEQMVAVLEENKHIALVYADVIKTRTGNETFEKCTPSGAFNWHDWDREILLTKGCFIGPQPVWRKKVHEEYGYFDERFLVSADFEFWLRISQTNDFYHISRPLGLYLERSESIEHSNVEKKHREDIEIIRMYQKAAANKEHINMNSKGPVSTTTTHDRQKTQQELKNNMNSVYGTAMATTGLNQGGNKMNSPDTVLKAIHHLIAEDYKEAAIWAVDKLLADFPGHAQIYDQAATIAFDAGDMDLAKGYFEQAAFLSPANAAYQKNLGDFYFAVQKDAERAMLQYERALEIEGQSVETLTMAGHVSMSLHRYADARNFYEQALTLDPGNLEISQIMEKLIHHMSSQQNPSISADEIHARATEKAREGDRLGAINLLEQLVGKDCDQAVIHNDLGVLYYECGEMNPARQHYEKAVSIEPGSEIYQKNLADFYWSVIGDHQLAMSAFVQVLKLNPQDIDALLNCGQICMTLNKMTDARAFFDSVLNLEPWNENAQKMIEQLRDLPAQTKVCANENIQNNPPSQSVANEAHDSEIHNLRCKIAESPDNAMLHNDLGVLYYEAGEKEKALASYQQAVQLDPNESNFQKNLADYYLIEMGMAEPAMKLYLEVLSRNPKDVEALNATGMICTLIGNDEDARYFYQRVLEIEPWNEDAARAIKNLAAESMAQGACTHDVQAVG